MSTEENKAVVRRFIHDGVIGGNLATIDELCSPERVNHSAPWLIDCSTWSRRSSSLLLAVVVSTSFVACRKFQGRKAVADECPPVAGRALTVERVRLRPNAPRAMEGVFDSQEALSESGYEIEGEGRPVRPDRVAPLPDGPPFDFGKHRIAYTTVRQNPNASVVWVVEAPTEIVVGLQVGKYCGGAAPPDTVAGAVVPASSKPVRFARCAAGACDDSIPRP